MTYAKAAKLVAFMDDRKWHTDDDPDDDPERMARIRRLLVAEDHAEDTEANWSEYTQRGGN